MVAFPNVKRGDVYYDCRWHRDRAGDRRFLTWKIEVIDVDTSAGMAVVKVDGGIPKTVTARFFANLVRTPIKRGIK